MVINLKKRFLIPIIITTIIITIILLLPKAKNNAEIQILDKDNKEIALLNNYNKTNSIEIENINPRLIEILLFIEDKDFYKHNGISIKRIIIASINNIINNSKYGASTITQQYIKNTYLNNSKNILRKIKEAILAIKLERANTKNEILEGYLSSLYFGNNIYGLHNACKYYYNKEINDLNINEIISLVALINAPSIYSNNLSKWNIKNKAIANKLLKNNLITNNEYNQINNGIILNYNKEFINSNRQYYIDQVINEFNSLNINSTFNKKIIIKTNYNRDTEKISSNLDTNYSIISINKNGYITSIIGDKSYYSSTYNIAINGNRDIGSTIKPLLYYEAIKCGKKNIKFTSLKYTFNYNNEIITISNNSNKYYDTIGLYTALAVSDNIYATKMHLYLGMKTLANHLKKYNITTASLPSLALGSVGMSLKKLACIYFQFFDNGKYIKPKIITNIVYNSKEYIQKTKYSIVNNKEICNEIKELLYAPFDLKINNSTCSSITNKLNMKCYGKSGLTDYDSYMIGFNEENLVAVWTGNINNEKLIDNNIKKLPKELFYKVMNIL